MKHLKKIMSLILTAIMVIAMCVPVMAANGTGTITMSGSDNSHTYSIYQILIGDYAGGKLSNVKWGSATDKSGTNVTDTELAAFTALSNNAQATADAVNAYVKNNAVATDTIVGNGSAIVPTGYYVIRDSYIDQDVAQSVSTHIVKVVGDVTVTPKVGVPTSDKKVDDKNDSNTNENNVEWKDSADYDIGDAVPFRLHGTLPENFNSYSSYKYIFHDTESAGLTFNADSVVVKVDNITGREAEKMINDDKHDKDLIILDVREPKDFNNGHLLNAINIPIEDIDKRMDELRNYKSKDIIVYCNTGRKSAEVAEKLVEHGFTDVTNTVDGVSEYDFKLVK